MSTETNVTFGDQSLTIYDHAGQRWLTSIDIAHALGYSRRDKMGALYRRHREEFDGQMTCTLKLRVQGQLRAVRIFSKNGAYLLAMLSKTKRGAEFRRWVLRVLGEHAEAAEVAASAPAATRDPLPQATPAVPASTSTSEPTVSLRVAFDLQQRLIDTQADLLKAKAGRRRNRATPKPLTNEEIAQMRALRVQGLPYAEIARRVGRSSGSVCMLCRDINPPDLFTGGAA